MSVHSGDDDDKSSVYSDSSTLVYDHESFSTFRERVLQLALKTVWPDAKPEEIIIERLAGGGYNRIIGLSLERDGRRTDYILRIPRFDAAQMDHDVAALLFVQRHTSIPVPQIVMFDETPNNELGDPYMIQRRLEGASAWSVFPTLDDEAKQSFATQLGGIYRQMLSISSSRPGHFQLPTDCKRSLDAPILIGQIGANSDQTTVYATGEPVVDPLTVIKEALVSHMAPGQENNPTHRLEIKLRDELCSMAEDAYNSGMIPADGYSLAHMDFASRNILVKTGPGSSQCEITGILDWDSAVLAPRYMSCQPPMWVWAWNNDEDEDERLANEIPDSAASRTNKANFESAAGEGYVEKAYQPKYRLLRQLFGYAVERIGFSEQQRAAEAMLLEWKSLRRAEIAANVDKQGQDASPLTPKQHHFLTDLSLNGVRRPDP